MRKIVGLDDKLIPLYDESNPELVQAMPTFRELLKRAAGQGQPKSADDSRRLGRVMTKLRKQGDVELTDEEFSALFDRLTENPGGFIVSIHSQVLEKLDAANL